MGFHGGAFGTIPLQDADSLQVENVTLVPEEGWVCEKRWILTTMSASHPPVDLSRYSLPSYYHMKQGF